MNNSSKIKKLTPSNTLDNFDNKVIKMVIEALLNEKDQEINEGKRKAYILANKCGGCPKHDLVKDDRGYDLVEEYLKTIECIDCEK